MRKYALFILLLLGCSWAHASAQSFSVSPVLSEQPLQNPSVNGYFDLLVKDTTPQTVSFRLKNLVDYPVTVVISTANAFTAANGDIVLKDETETAVSRILDEAFQMKPYLTAPSAVTLAAGSEQTIPITIHTPSLQKGSLLGGVLFKDQENEKKNAKAGNSFQVHNELSFGIAVQLTYPTPEHPDFAFADSKVEASPSGIKLFIGMENRSALILQNQTVRYTVKDPQNQTVFSGRIDHIKMAPKTSLQYPVFWNASSISPANYTVILEGSGDETETTTTKVAVSKEVLQQYQKFFPSPTTPAPPAVKGMGSQEQKQTEENTASSWIEICKAFLLHPYGWILVIAGGGLLAFVIAYKKRR